MSESTKRRGWQLFDYIVHNSPARNVNPWRRVENELEFAPHYPTLTKLLGVPLLLKANSQSGVPALALDVWISFELRRAGFADHKVWPRATVPRVLPDEVNSLLTALPNSESAPIKKRIESRPVRGVSTASANILGKNYVKQVDVVMSSWQTGPELMVSTKRMDSSFGKNAANRVEESYGDARNLRARHPESALGFFYSMRSTALASDRKTADWLIDLLGKLGRADDAYDAVGLIIPEWSEGEAAEDEDDEDRLAAAGLRPTEGSEADDVPADIPPASVEASIEQLPVVKLRHEAVPPNLDPGRFLSIMVDRVLANSPVNYHIEARERRQAASSPG